METSPEFVQGGGNKNYYGPQFSAEMHQHSDNMPGEAFLVDDLLDFPCDGLLAPNGVDGDAPPSDAHNIKSSFSGTSPDQPRSTDDDLGLCCFPDSQLPGDICFPQCDELAELEWLSNFVEESFSCEDLQKLQLISAIKAPADDQSSGTHPQTTKNSPAFSPEMSVRGKARSKRSRAAPCNWTSRLLVVSSPNPEETMSSSSSDPNAPSGSGKKAPRKKEAVAVDSHMARAGGGDGRRCVHCATDKTPQWRTGPMGPKTLCNACGVRYKSGRLMPEYRPAASPTFVLTKHSNSHRKVLELRRQNEMMKAQQQQQQLIHHHQHQFLHPQSMVFDLSNTVGDDFLIHQHMGQDFRHMI